MNKIEFYQDGENVLYKMDSQPPRILSAGDRWLISALMNRLETDYPKALHQLEKEYEKLKSEPWNYQRRIVSRFIKCNFGRIDPVPDMDELGIFHFEHVDCPLRGECRCEGIICLPEFDNPLSEREREVMKMVAIEGKSPEKTADLLCISLFTVKKHISNSYAKVGVCNEADFTRWALKHGVFKD